MNTFPEHRQDPDSIYRSNAIATIFENALFSLIRLGISPYILLPFYMKQLTNSTFLIGLIPAVYVLGFALPQMMMAKVIQRTKNRKRILVLSSLAQRICILGLLLLTIFQSRFPNWLTIALFFFIYLLFNLARGCYSPTWIDFLGRAVPYNRGKILGIGSFIGGFLNLLGSLVLTRLLTDLPYPQAITAVLALSLAGSAVSFIAILFLKEVQPDEPEPAPSAGVGPYTPVSGNQPSGVFRRFLAWRSVIIGLEMMLSFYTLWGLEKFNLPVSYVGIFAAILTISDAVSNPMWGWLGDKIGYLRVIVSASVLGCLGAALAAFAPSPFWFSLIFLLNGIMLSGQQQGGINIIYEFAARRDVPIYTAIQQVILSLLSGLAPVLGGIITGSIGYIFGSLASGSIGLAGAAGMLLQVRSPRMENGKETIQQRSDGLA